MVRIGSWVPAQAGSDFTIYNLPYGAFRRERDPARLGVAIGNKILDLNAAAEAGLLDAACDRELVKGEKLNPLLAAGPEVWKALRLRLVSLLRDDDATDPALRNLNHSKFFVLQSDVTMTLPMEIGDYVDFYSSIEHATNLGRLFRPKSEPLLPNWRWMPIGYHGRSATIVIDGTPIVRPSGQIKSTDSANPTFAPTQRLDIELEVGFVIGPGNALGEPIPVGRAREHIFGLVLVNDWTARDVQVWEYQPLGPFLGKSFATTISPWIVTLDALEPFRTKGPVQEPPPLPHLRGNDWCSYDINLAVDLQTRSMRDRNVAPVTISETNFLNTYWNMAQQLAHLTSNGAAVRPGDLCASGTISGTARRRSGSLIEITWNGTEPLQLPEGEQRTFLQNGDEVRLRGWSEAGQFRIGFGSARGRIEHAR
jgi:fumarylacetoacetase